MRREKKTKIGKKRVIIIVLSIILIISGIYLFNIYSTQKDNTDLKKYIEDENVNEIVSTQEMPNGDSTIVQDSERINKVKELQTQNSDIVGWLEIPGSNISYPVLQGIDNSYYMNHNYKKKRTKDGSLFLDKDYNWDKPSSNLLIYGHNNRGSKEMFVSLLDYKKESFYKEHSEIRFTTEKEDAIYDVISVFLSRVYYKHEKDVFRYYFFIDAENKEEFDEYVQESKKASLYDIEATAEYGDQLITLSTCEYSQEDGRFVVVARKRK